MDEKCPITDAVYNTEQTQIVLYTTIHFPSKIIQKDNKLYFSDMLAFFDYGDINSPPNSEGLRVFSISLNYPSKNVYLRVLPNILYSNIEVIENGVKTDEINFPILYEKEDQNNLNYIYNGKGTSKCKDEYINYKFTDHVNPVVIDAIPDLQTCREWKKLMDAYIKANSPLSPYDKKLVKNAFCNFNGKITYAVPQEGDGGEGDGGEGGEGDGGEGDGGEGDGGEGDGGEGKVSPNKSRSNIIYFIIIIVILIIAIILLLSLTKGLRR